MDNQTQKQQPLKAKDAMVVRSPENGGPAQPIASQQLKNAQAKKR